MKIYIDADDAIRKWCVLNCGCEPNECGHTLEEDGTEACTFVDFIKNLPAAVAVEMLRCKDCIHGKLGNHEDIMCDYWDFDGLDSNDFCSYGERR